MLVRLNVAVAGLALTVTVYAPTLPLAVKTPAVATPLALVFTVIVPVLLEKVPDWPLPPATAVNVTEVFATTGFPL